MYFPFAPRPACRRGHRILIPAFLFLLALLSACTVRNTGPDTVDLDLPVMTDKPHDLKTFRVVPDCRADAPRLSLINIYWDDPAAGKTPQRVDLTPFKRGFASGLYYTMATGKDQQLQPAGAEASVDNLKISFEDVKTRDYRFDEKGGRAQLALGGLVPGMTYFLRISRFDANNNQWMPSQTLRFDAPVCRNDQVDEK